VSGENGQRLDDLLLARATDGLDSAETAELEGLLASTEEVEPDAYDEAAAWFWLGAGDPDAEMPESAAARARAGLGLESPSTGDARVTAFRAPKQSSPPPRPSRLPWVAAAAALVLAVAGWWPRLDGGGPTGPAGSPSLAEARDQLIEEAPDLVRVEWSNTEHPRAQQLRGGYVVWSDELQKGYMTFRGIPDNDPNEQQYQLWVFDAKRSEQYPVDGGVFDAPTGGEEVIVPIRTKLPVQQAALFAVTLEPPGGVVVSDRDPILWVAKPQTS
jgi:hypothetical protein